ncbi:GtrA family protein [Planomonospora sp. ID67723]|uniref:GtrA family protein n=1 Tax=Planomonospora sp. ID67723 TaxID=2738134 RepID=UPI0018C382AE|nr:GtrA family protein [Planomonospora sp. ID67723]MBG0827858.1 GtrA family protein [Planomonospora sp. ID67723]
MTEIDVQAVPVEASGPRVRPFASVLLGQRITYLMGGVMTVAFYLSFLALGLMVLGNRVPYLFLVVASHLATVVIVYPWYRIAVFRAAGGSWIAGYLRFYAVGLGFLAMSLVGLPVLVELVGMQVLAAQFAVMAVSALGGYAVNKSWTFRDRRKV